VPDDEQAGLTAAMVMKLAVFEIAPSECLRFRPADRFGVARWVRARASTNAFRNSS
jgi:hypothetical protein